MNKNSRQSLYRIYTATAARGFDISALFLLFESQQYNGKGKEYYG